MAEMTAKERLRENLGAEYMAYIQRWETASFEVMLQDAEKLAAAKQIKGSLADQLTEGDAALLLHKNVTLETLVEQYVQVANAQQTLQHYLSQLSAMQFKPGEGLTVKELLSQAPGSGLNMMTPDGYILLTPEQAKALLDGEPTFASAGVHGTEQRIEADNVLNMVVIYGGMKKGVWDVLVDYPQEEQAQDIGGQSQCL